MKQARVGLIGFGVIGAGVVKILSNQRDLLETRVGFPISLQRIADLDLDTDRGVPVDRSIMTTNAYDIINDPNIDIVVELIGGYEPAKQFILESFAKGKNIVTANKALLAVHGPELFKAAGAARVSIAFEGAVAGAIPILRSLREGLVANRFDKVMAILNGTCNYILTAMDENPGLSFDETLQEAQELGYAESDPSLDVDGIDAAHKLALTLCLTHGIRAPFDRIHVEGIREIESFDSQMAREFSYKIKLLAIIKSQASGVEVRLHPTMIPKEHPLGKVDGVFNGIYLKGDMVGDQLFYGRGAGMDPTASSVVGDIVEIARNLKCDESCQAPPLGYPEDKILDSGILPIDDIITNYYIRVQALDRPGVLSRVSGIMAEHGISIHSVVQKGRDLNGAVPVVFITHSAKESGMMAAAKKIGALDVVAGPITLIRIEDEDLT